MDKKTKLFCAVLAVLFPFIVFVSAIEAAVFDKAFFMKEMDANNVIENIGLYPPDMEPVVEEILSFLKGDRLDFDIQARLITKNDNNSTDYISIFNDKEITHMIDVRDLFQFFLTLRDFAMALALILSVVLYKKNPFAIVKAFFYGSVIFVGFFLLIGGCFYFNFNAAFTLFHQLFFSNDLWLLDPSKDRLILIVPEPFFFNLIARMAIYTIIPLGLTAAATGTVLYKKTKKFDNNNNRNNEQATD